MEEGPTQELKPDSPHLHLPNDIHQQQNQLDGPAQRRMLIVLGPEWGTLATAVQHATSSELPPSQSDRPKPRPPSEPLSAESRDSHKRAASDLAEAVDLTSFSDGNGDEVWSERNQRGRRRSASRSRSNSRSRRGPRSDKWDRHRSRSRSWSPSYSRDAPRRHSSQHDGYRKEQEARRNGKRDRRRAREDRRRSASPIRRDEPGPRYLTESHDDFLLPLDAPVAPAFSAVDPIPPIPALGGEVDSDWSWRSLKDEIQFLQHVLDAFGDKLKIVSLCPSLPEKEFLLRLPASLPDPSLLLSTAVTPPDGSDRASTSAMDARIAQCSLDALKYLYSAVPTPSSTFARPVITEQHVTALSALPSDAPATVHQLAEHMRGLAAVRRCWLRVREGPKQHNGHETLWAVARKRVLKLQLPKGGMTNGQATLFGLLEGGMTSARWRLEIVREWAQVASNNEDCDTIPDLRRLRDDLPTAKAE